MPGNSAAPPASIPRAKPSIPKPKIRRCSLALNVLTSWKYLNPAYKTPIKLTVTKKK